MNASKKRSLSLITLGQGFIELLFYLPVFMIIAVYLLPSSALWPWIATLPLCYWAASLWIGRFPRLRNGVKLLLAIGLGALHSGLCIVVWVGETNVIPLVITGVVAVIVALRGMSSQVSGWSVSFSNTLMLTGIIIYVAVQPLKLVLFKKLIDYNEPLIVCGIAVVILFFFFANERHFNSETVDSRKTSATHAFKRQNRLLVIIMVVIISILAMFRQIQKMIEHFFQSVIKWFLNLFDGSKGEAPAEELPDDPPVTELPYEPAKPPSDFMLLMEQIFKIFGTLLVIVAGCFLLYFIIKKLIQLAKLIASKLQERGADALSSGVGYTDEVESLMTLTNLREQMRNKLKALLPKKRSFAQEWNELSTNTEKIRYLYARLLRTSAEQGYSVKDHLTPRETTEELADWQDGRTKLERMPQFIEVYEEARYGDKLPNDQQINAFKQQFEKKGNQA